MKTKEEMVNSIKENDTAKWIKIAVTGAIISGVGAVAYTLGKTHSDAECDALLDIPFDKDEVDQGFWRHEEDIEGDDTEE